VCRLVELRKHLNASDRHVMVDHVIHQLSVQDLLDALDLCSEPFAHKCRLCRVRRLDALEFRMLHDQVQPRPRSRPAPIVAPLLCLTMRSLRRPPKRHCCCIDRCPRA
jgi:hypothetical protein